MSFLSRLFGAGVGEAAGAVGSAAKDLADVFTTSDREKLDAYRAETDRMRAARELDLAQVRANEAAARHPSLFVAGARPAVIWICALGMLYHFFIFPMAGPFIAEATGVKLLPLDWQELSVALGGLLGFGGLRTVEKVKGVARDNLKGDR